MFFVILLCIKKRQKMVKETNFVNEQIHGPETELNTYSGTHSEVNKSESIEPHHQSEDKEKKDDSVLENDDYSHLHDIVREKESYSGNTYTTLTNCKSETGDDVNESELYNHLRETSVHEADDIYNHVIDENDCEYSFADSTRDSDAFCNYDHIVHPSTQDNFDDYR
ncbi:uncharacterized protein LOC134252970 [Saccostrea cucullata]|uniref:uncharacterized protein LOC134252970 n=1 Tax=Saccostrea cuccullata TaxID=36930 RepID=UPI002ED2E9C5